MVLPVPMSLVPFLNSFGLKISSDPQVGAVYEVVLRYQEKQILKCRGLIRLWENLR